MANKAVVWKVRELAEERGMSKRTLGFRAELFAGSVNGVWNGTTRQINIDTISRLVTALDVGPGDLFKIVDADGDFQPLPDQPEPATA